VPRYGGGIGIEEEIGSKRRRVLALARRYGAANVRVFGSVARRQATKSSDVDLFVDPVGRTYRPIDRGLALMKELGRSVDIVSERALHWYLQPAVVTESIPL
jgi:predicted nucleotidyltransferase